MSAWKQGLLVILTLSLFLGCSSTSNGNPDDGMTPTTGQSQPTDVKGDQEVAATGVSGAGQTGSSTVVDADGVEIVSEPADTKPPEPQTGMNIEEGVDRLFQNGPSAEEIKRYTAKPERRSYKFNNEGDNGAPVFDDNVEEIIL